jgi:hypothetical protein
MPNVTNKVTSNVIGTFHVNMWITLVSTVRLDLLAKIPVTLGKDYQVLTSNASEPFIIDDNGNRLYKHAADWQYAEKYLNSHRDPEKLKEKAMTTPKQTVEHTGGSSSCYDIVIDVKVQGTRTPIKPALVSCESIITALNMNFSQGTLFKVIWRLCAGKLGRKKKGNNAKYDAEKLVYYSNSILEQETKI